MCGNRDRIGFREMASWLETMKTRYDFSLFEYDTPEAYLAVPETNAAAVDMFFIFQEYPGQYPQAMFDRLRTRQPLARFALLLDSLCRGELRTGYPASLTGRFYLDQWNSVGRLWFEAFLRGEKGFFSMPLTYNDADVVCDLVAPREGNSPFLDSILDSVASWDGARQSYRNSIRPFAEARTGASLGVEKPTVLPTETVGTQNELNLHRIGPDDLTDGGGVEKQTCDDLPLEVFVVAQADPELGRFIVELCSKRSLGANQGTFEQLFDLPCDPGLIVIDCVDLADQAFRLQIENISRRFSHSSIRILAFAPHSEEIVEYESFPRCRVCGKPF